MLKIKSLWLMSFAALVLAGCSSTPPITGGEKEEPQGTGDDYEPDGGNEAEVQDTKSDGEIIAGVRSFLSSKCSGCHGSGRSLGQLSDVLDVNELRSRNLIGTNADNSGFFTLVSGEHRKGDIDPRSKKEVSLASEQDIGFVRQWLDLGAPELRGNRQVMGLDFYLQRLRREVSKFSRAEQNDLVVIDFHAVYNNPRFSNAEMAAFANASLKLLNGLDVRSTTANRVGIRVANDDNNLPIGIVFNPKRFNLDKQQDIVDTIFRLSNRQDANNPFTFNGDDSNPCDIISIPALDFLHIASSDDVFNPIDNTFESGYSNIGFRRLLEDAGLLAPGQLVFDPIDADQFIAQGFTIAANVDLFDLLEAVDPTNFNRNDLDVLYNEGNDRERLVRGCVLNSNVSAGNRCIDRLSQSDPSDGATYLSWDILSFGNVNGNQDFFEAFFVGPANPAADPLFRNDQGFQPFEVDGGEGIFQLKNSMLAFSVYNANFQLVSNPPTFAVLNNLNLERGSFISVSACSYCHSGFTIPWEDKIRATLEGSANGGEFAEAGFAFKISQSPEDWAKQFQLDQQFYTDVLRNVYVSRGESGDLPDGIWSLGSQYMNDLTIDDIVAEAGLLDADSLADSIDNNTDQQADLRSLFGGGISRENFTVNYQLFVNQIATGNQDFLRGCVAREASDVGDFGDNDDGTDNGSNNGDN